MIVGNGLPEPLYASTNSFGYYSFSDIPFGESYVLQVFSRKYIFEQSSFVISLEQNVTDANFLGSDW